MPSGTTGGSDSTVVGVQAKPLRPAHVNKWVQQRGRIEELVGDCQSRIKQLEAVVATGRLARAQKESVLDDLKNELEALKAPLSFYEARIRESDADLAECEVIERAASGQPLARKVEPNGK